MTVCGLGPMGECTCFAEPTNAVPPRVTHKNIDIKTVEVDSVFVGLCPSQAFPVPAYR